MTKRLSRFTYKKQVGKGAFSRVYKVEDEDGKYYALKEVSMTDLDNLQSAIKESLIANLKHENILNYEYIDIIERPKELEKFVLNDGNESRPSSVLNVYADKIKLEMGRCGAQHNFEEPMEECRIINDDGMLITQFGTERSVMSRKLAIADETQYSIFDNSFEETMFYEELPHDIQDVCREKKKKYCYLITEYCPFSLREFIDCRNDFYFNNKDAYKELTCSKNVLSEKRSSNQCDIEDISKFTDCFIKKCNLEGFERKETVNNTERNIDAIKANKKSKNFHTSDELGIRRKIPKCLIKASFNKDLSINTSFVYTLIKQILLGLIYLQSKNIVHNDLKPSNIFFGENLKPKIGDFGMMNFFNCDKFLFGDKSVDVWVKNSLSYDDVYNDMKQVGLLFFELLYPVRTAMERYQVLPDIDKRNVLPADLVQKHPKASEIILACINYTPNNPLLADDILLKLSKLS